MVSVWDLEKEVDNRIANSRETRRQAVDSVCDAYELRCIESFPESTSVDKAKIREINRYACYLRHELLKTGTYSKE
jgi:hypothetical protein